MRIQQLYLDSYGPFTNTCLDLSGEAGLHILYGPNEAGKSTTLRAVLGFFFGIDPRTRDNHLHAYAALRIGMRLRQADGRELLLYRRKGNRDTLLDTDNRPVPEHDLHQALGGLSEAQYSALFGFDHARLLEGGEHLLKGGGELGQSLFEAGAGVASLQGLLRALDKEMDSLYKKSGTNPHLNRALSRYHEAEKAIKSASLSAKHWQDQEKMLHDAEAQEERLAEALRQLQSRRQRLQRVERTAPLVGEWLEMDAGWQELAAVLLLPESASADRHAILQEQASGNQAIQHVEQELANLKTQLNELDVPESLLVAKPRIEQLNQHLAAYGEAKLESPKTRAKLQSLEHEIALLAQCLPPAMQRDTGGGFCLQTLQTAQIQRLIRAYPEQASQYKHAQQQLQELGSELKQRRQELAALAPLPDLGRLRAAYEAARQAGPLEDQLRDLLEEYAGTEAACDGMRRRLGLSQVPLEALPALHVPPVSTLQRFEQAFEERARQKRDLDTQRIDLHQRRDQYSAHHRALDLAGQVPTEADLAAVRKQRDAGWALLRRLWVEQEAVSPAECQAYAGEASPAAVFERDLEYADALADRLRREAARVAEWSSLLAQEEGLAKALAELEVREADHQQAVRALEAQWQAAWEPVSLRPQSLREMREWQTDFAQLLARLENLARCRQTLKSRQAALEAHRVSLSQALQAAGVQVQTSNALMAILVKQAGDLLDGLEREVGERQHLARDLEGMVQRQRSLENKLQTAQAALEAWTREWARAIKPLGLERHADPLDVQSVLETLQTFAMKSEALEGMQHQLSSQQSLLDTFAQDVAQLLREFIPDEIDAAPERGVACLKRRLEAAEKHEERRDVLTKQLNEQEAKLAAQRAAVVQLQVRLDALMKQAHCQDLKALERAEEASIRKRELQARREDVQRELLRLGDGLRLAALIEEVRATPLATITAELAELGDKESRLDAEKRTLNQRIGELRRDFLAMDGGPQAALAAEQAAQALADVRQYAERYLRVRLAARLLRQAIDHYREANQGPILTRAGALFGALTCGAFANLTSDYNDHDQPILLGIRNQGAQVSVEGMSEGTRDQLYLALRLASIERLLERQEVLPILMDDILVNFDDQRTEATLKMLSTLSQRTQILYFTHHARIAEQAVRTLPEKSVQVHHLEN